MELSFTKTGIKLIADRSDPNPRPKRERIEPINFAFMHEDERKKDKENTLEKNEN